MVSSIIHDAQGRPISSPLEESVFEKGNSRQGFYNSYLQAMEEIVGFAPRERFFGDGGQSPRHGSLKAQNWTEIFNEIHREYKAQPLLKKLFSTYAEFFHALFIHPYKVSYESGSSGEHAFKDCFSQIEDKEEKKVTAFARGLNLPMLLYLALQRDREKYGLLQEYNEVLEKRKFSVSYHGLKPEHDKPSDDPGSRENMAPGLEGVLQAQFSPNLWHKVVSNSDDCIFIQHNPATGRVSMQKYWFASLLHMAHPHIYYLSVMVKEGKELKGMFPFQVLNIKLLETSDEKRPLIVGGVLGDNLKHWPGSGLTKSIPNLSEYVDIVVWDFFEKRHQSPQRLPGSLAKAAVKPELLYNTNHQLNERPYSQFVENIKIKHKMRRPFTLGKSLRISVPASSAENDLLLLANIPQEGKGGSSETRPYKGEQYSETFAFANPPESSKEKQQRVGAFVNLEGKVNAISAGEHFPVPKNHTVRNALLGFGLIGALLLGGLDIYRSYREPEKLSHGKIDPSLKWEEFTPAIGEVLQESCDEWKIAGYDLSCVRKGEKVLELNLYDVDSVEVVGNTKRYPVSYFKGELTIQTKFKLLQKKLKLPEDEGEKLAGLLNTFQEKIRKEKEKVEKMGLEEAVEYLGNCYRERKGKIRWISEHIGNTDALATIVETFPCGSHFDFWSLLPYSYEETISGKDKEIAGMTVSGLAQVYAEYRAAGIPLDYWLSELSGFSLRLADKKCSRIPKRVEDKLLEYIKLLRESTIIPSIMVLSYKPMELITKEEKHRRPSIFQATFRGNVTHILDHYLRLSFCFRTEVAKLFANAVNEYSAKHKGKVLHLPRLLRIAITVPSENILFQLKDIITFHPEEEVNRIIRESSLFVNGPDAPCFEHAFRKLHLDMPIDSDSLGRVISGVEQYIAHKTAGTNWEYYSKKEDSYNFYPPLTTPWSLFPILTTIRDKTCYQKGIYPDYTSFAAEYVPQVQKVLPILSQPSVAQAIDACALPCENGEVPCDLKELIKELTTLAMDKPAEEVAAQASLLAARMRKPCPSP